MNRQYKTIICIVGIIIGLGIIVSCFYLAKKNLANGSQTPSIPKMVQNDQITPKIDDNSNRYNESNDDNVFFPFVDITTVPKLTIGYIIAISCGSLILCTTILYFLLSSFCVNKILININKKILFALVSVIISAILSTCIIYYINNNILLKSTYLPHIDNISDNNNQADNDTIIN